MRFPSSLGLRAQIVVALSLVFALSFWLAGFTALQLTRRTHMKSWVVTTTSDGSYTYRVMLGGFATQAEAERAADRLLQRSHLQVELGELSGRRGELLLHVVLLRVQVVRVCVHGLYQGTQHHDQSNDSAHKASTPPWLRPPNRCGDRPLDRPTT